MQAGQILILRHKYLFHAWMMKLMMDAMVAYLSLLSNGCIKMKSLMRLVLFIEPEDVIMGKHVQVMLDAKPATQVLTNATHRTPTRSTTWMNTVQLLVKRK